MRVRELIDVIEATADPGRAASWDRSGVQVAGTRTTCDKLAMGLDATPALIRDALDWGAQVILVHHPLTLSPRLPDRLDDFHRMLTLLLPHGVWLYAAHTSLDVVTDGPAGWLADELGLRNRRVLEPAGTIPSLAARWTMPDPRSGREALAGMAGVTARTDGPDLLEAVFAPGHKTRVMAAVAAASPQAALFSLTELREPATVYGYGLVGDLPAPLSLEALKAGLAALLPRRFFVQAGNGPQSVTTVAYCPGSGADMAPRAFAAGAEVYVTGDLKYHQAQVVPADRCVLDVGHFSLEEVMMRRFAAALSQTLGPSGPDVRFFPGNDPFSVHIPTGTASLGTE